MGPLSPLAMGLRKAKLMMNPPPGGRAEDDRPDLFVPHYALTVDALPAPGAPWEQLIHFAGTFDGSVVLPERPLAEKFGADSRAAYAADGSLPEGLTMLRAALHAEQRDDYWSEEPGRGPSDLTYVHALVDRICELVIAGAHIAPSPWTVGGISDKVMNAYDRLLVGYASWGGWRYHGWLSYEDQANFLGPVIWSERDCDLRFCLELEKEWPGAVHQEFAISKSSRADYDPTTEKFQRVDVAVSDLSGFIEDASTGARFVRHRHEAFFEVKWFVKGFGTGRDAKARWADIPIDVAKLANHLAKERCAVAGMLAFDDEEYFQAQTLEDGWPAGVWRLYVGPSALRWRGLIRDAPSEPAA
jgi:hypothetical protein